MTRSLSQIESLELAISLRGKDLSVSLDDRNPTLEINTERHVVHLEFANAAAWRRFAERIAELHAQPGHGWDRNGGGK